MKNIKKVIAIVIALAMLMTISMTAFAEETSGSDGNTEGTQEEQGESSKESNLSYDGKITIKTIDGQKYKLYKLFDATVISGRAEGGDGISYSLMAGKTDFKAGDNDGATWFKLENGNVVKTGTSIDDVDHADDFRAWAEKYGTPNETEISGDGNEKAWTDLASGYYYITTTTGSLVTVTSITPDVTVQDKNTVPSLDKKIEKVTDNNGTTNRASVAEDQESAHVEIGDTVEYSVAIKGYKGAENYIFEDTLSSGLTLGGESDLSITGTNPEGTLVKDTDYKLDTFDSTSGVIKITFQKAYLDKLTGEGTAPSVITIKYKATVNEKAVSGAAGNANSAKLSYGHDPNSLTSTTPDSPKVYVAEIDVNKYTGENANGEDSTKLNGVKFVLQNESGAYYKYANNSVTWTTVEAGENIDAYKLETAEGGKLQFKGLADGKYTLTETDPLAGYNNIAPVTITISKGTYTDANLIQKADVKNSSGAELPTTGGMGTTIFYMLGSVLVLGAGVVMITRRRMS